MNVASSNLQRELEKTGMGVEIQLVHWLNIIRDPRFLPSIPPSTRLQLKTNWFSFFPSCNEGVWPEIFHSDSTVSKTSILEMLTLFLALLQCSNLNIHRGPKMSPEFPPACSHTLPCYWFKLRPAFPWVRAGAGKVINFTWKRYEWTRTRTITQN